MDYLLQFRRYRLPFRVPVRTAHGLWSEREGLLIRLERPDGSVGYGEASPIPAFGSESVDEAESILRSLGSRVSDESLGAIPAGMPTVRNACASASVPCRLISGGQAHPVAALLPAGRLALDLAPALGDAGFRTFKWKVGVGDSADEMAIMDDLFAGLPSGSKIRLDANGAWDRRRAERWLSRCAGCPVDYVEQPVAPEARGAEDLLQGLAGDYPVPIALDESVASDDGIGHWIGLGWKGIYVIKPSLLGDPGRTLGRLSAAGSEVVFSSALETAVGAQSALRWAFGWTGARRALGFGVWPLFKDLRFDGPALAPFLRWEDVQRINPNESWSALS